VEHGKEPCDKPPGVNQRGEAHFDYLKETLMETLGEISQFLIVLNGNHFAAIALIALVAVASRRPPND
jgi:hypothetical protein